MTKKDIKLWKEYRKHLDEFNNPLIVFALNCDWTPDLSSVLKKPSYVGFMDWISDKKASVNKKV